MAPQCLKITQFLKHHDNSHWAKSTPTSLLLLRTVQKEFWSVYLKVLEGNIIQQDSNRVDKKALKMFPQRHTRNSNLPENILVLKPWYRAMNNKWPVMDCGKIGKNDNRQKNLWDFEKWSQIKVTHKNASSRPPRIAYAAYISDDHLVCLSGQKKVVELPSLLQHLFEFLVQWD